MRTTSSCRAFDRTVSIAALAEFWEVTSSSTTRRLTPSRLAVSNRSSAAAAFRLARARMLAYRVCPADAKARAVRFPMPVAAPVIRTRDTVLVEAGGACRWPIGG